MLDLFKLVLYSNLKLENLISIVGVFNLLSNFLSLSVHSSLEERLSMVQLVLVDIWIKLGELVIHV